MSSAVWIPKFIICFVFVGLFCAGLFSVNCQAQSAYQDYWGNVNIIGNQGYINYVRMDRNNDRVDQLRVETLAGTKVFSNVASIYVDLRGSLNMMTVENLPNIADDFIYLGSEGADLIEMSVGRSLHGGSNQNTWIGNDVVIETYGGTDIFRTRDNNAPAWSYGDLKAGGEIEINTGEDSDTVEVTQVQCDTIRIDTYGGNDNIDCDPRTVLGDLVITTGEDDDDVRVFSYYFPSTVGGRTHIATMNGNDDVVYQSRSQNGVDVFTGFGSDTFESSNLAFISNVNINTGDDNESIMSTDTISLDNCVFEAMFDIETGGGNDDVTLSDCINENFLFIDTGDLADQVTIKNHIAYYYMSVDMGSGADDLQIEDSQFGSELIVDGGTGYDYGNFRNCTFRRSPDRRNFESGNMR